MSYLESRKLSSSGTSNPNHLMNPTPQSQGGAQEWHCPWCGREAQREQAEDYPERRLCGCGAVAMAAPAVDSDEIIDAALAYFRVPVAPNSRGFDALFLQDIRRSGIEIREGAFTQNPDLPPFWATTCHLWFRRRGPDDLISNRAASSARPTTSPIYRQHCVSPCHRSALTIP